MVSYLKKFNNLLVAFIYIFKFHLSLSLSLSAYNGWDRAMGTCGGGGLLIELWVVAVVVGHVVGCPRCGGH